MKLGALAEPPAAAYAPTTSPSGVTARSSGLPATSSAAAARSSTSTTSRSARCTAGRISAAQRTTSGAQRAPSGSAGRSASSEPVMPGPAGLPTSRPARPASWILSSRMASAASSTPATRDRVGERAERGGQRRLVAGLRR